jgi:ABC-type branched-subunit amino acid transport system substrate-binding protein
MDPMRLTDEQESIQTQGNYRQTAYS